MSEIAIDILSELFVLANVAQLKSNDVHSYPGYEYDSGRVSTICTVIKSGARPDLVVNEAGVSGSIPWCAHIFSVLFFLFNILMLNCFIY